MLLKPKTKITMGATMISPMKMPVHRAQRGYWYCLKKKERFVCWWHPQLLPKRIKLRQTFSEFMATVHALPYGNALSVAGETAQKSERTE